MHEVGRESHGLPLHVDGKVVAILSDMHALQQSLHLVHVGRSKGAKIHKRRRERDRETDEKLVPK